MTADEVRELTERSIEIRENTIDEEQLNDIFEEIKKDAENGSYCTYYCGITPGNKNVLIKNGFSVIDDEICWSGKTNND